MGRPEEAADVGAGSARHHGAVVKRRMPAGLLQLPTDLADAREVLQAGAARAGSGRGLLERARHVHAIVASRVGRAAGQVGRAAVRYGVAVAVHGIAEAVGERASLDLVVARDEGAFLGVPDAQYIDPVPLAPDVEVADELAMEADEAGAPVDRIVRIGSAQRREGAVPVAVLVVDELLGRALRRAGRAGVVAGADRIVILVDPWVERALGRLEGIVPAGVAGGTPPGEQGGHGQQDRGQEQEKEGSTRHGDLLYFAKTPDVGVWEPMGVEQTLVGRGWQV